MSQEPPAEALASPLSETPPWMMILDAQPLSPSSDDDGLVLFDSDDDDDDDDDELSETQPSMMMNKYSDDFAATGYDKNRSLWIGDLLPWMDKDYFINFFRHFEKVVLATVIKNKQTQLPEYGFFEFTSTRVADRTMTQLNELPMPNSKQRFQFKWATDVCGPKRPDKRFRFNWALVTDPRLRSLLVLPDLPDKPDLPVLVDLPELPDWPHPYYTLLIIEFVRVYPFKSYNRSAKVSGKVIECLRNFVVYDRTEDDGELTFLSGDHLTLTGPVANVNVGDGFNIEVELHINGEEIAQGEIFWNPLYKGLPVSHKLNKHLEENILGEYGHVTVGYSVVKYALSAVVEILLIPGDGCGCATVYGTIKAMLHIGNFDSVVELFNKFEDECVVVHSEHAIPLTRSLVVMPIQGFSVALKLWDRETGSIIAEGEKYFKPGSKTQTKSIGGNGGYGQVEVSVTCF